MILYDPICKMILLSNCNVVHKYFYFFFYKKYLRVDCHRQPKNGLKK